MINKNQRGRFGRVIQAATIAVCLFASPFLGTAAGVDQGLTVLMSAPDQYTVSWNAFLSQGLTLQSSTDLEVGNWTNVATPPMTLGTRQVVIVDSSELQVFFRLDCNGVVGAGPDLPDDGFVDTNCDGIDGDIAVAIFVSPLGSDLDPGTIMKPVRSIATAITKAVTQGKHQIYAAAGTYSAASFSLVNGVSIYGGYNATDWTRSDANITTLSASSSTALTANNLTSTTTLDHLRIIGASSSAAGGSAYGILANNSAGLIVHKCTVQAGTGGGGLAGTGGSAGANGGDGIIGQPGCEQGIGPNCSTCSQPQGGPGGASTCGHDGGPGGLPGLGFLPGVTGGIGPDGTPGGTGGLGGGNGNANPGSPGANGTAGTDGTAAVAGSFGSGGYVPTTGGAGTDATPGNGGGGGGGGGGGVVSCDSYGSSGGGGGAGGCGGTAASGGLSGGGSFAIYLFGSNAHLESCTLITGNGGAGGAGGTGGAPGIHGSGGPGGPYGGPTEQDDGGNGAAGGIGGDGGRGGHGGGGAGGSSIGVLKAGGSIPTITSPTFTIGNAGPGGASAGHAGPSGTAATTFP